MDKKENTIVNVNPTPQSESATLTILHGDAIKEIDPKIVRLRR